LLDGTSAQSIGHSVSWEGEEREGGIGGLLLRDGVDEGKWKRKGDRKEERDKEGKG